MPACLVIGESPPAANCHHCSTALNAHDDLVHSGSHRHCNSIVDAPSGPEVRVALSGDDAIHIAFRREQIKFVLRIFTKRKHGAAGQSAEVHARCRRAVLVTKPLDPARA